MLRRQRRRKTTPLAAAAAPAAAAAVSFILLSFSVLSSSTTRATVAAASSSSSSLPVLFFGRCWSRGAGSARLRREETRPLLLLFSTTPSCYSLQSRTSTMAPKRKATTLTTAAATSEAAAAAAAAAATTTTTSSKAETAAAAIKEGGRSEGGRGSWMDIRVPAQELRPEFSLMMGQCFNWRRQIDKGVKEEEKEEEEKEGRKEGLMVEAAAEVVKGEERGGGKGEEDKVWVGVLDRYIVEVQQTRTTTFVRRVVVASGEGVGMKKEEGGEEEVLLARLRDYFQVGTPLAPLYARWAQGDPRMKIVADSLPGVRVVRQDPVECLFSFICSSNNNIARIGLMLTRLRQTYGEPLGDGHYAFPSVSSLAAASEEDLRVLGLGYRARFIKETATKLKDLGGKEWLWALRGKERKEVQELLCAFPGVGRKVADCVALFSLDQHGAIPVDVHVWRIACRDYDLSLKGSKSLTPSIYESVGDLFRGKFGPHAGWAHSLLFAAELPKYRALLPLTLQNEMVAFKKEEGGEKALKREKKKQEKKKTMMMVKEEEEEQEEEWEGEGERMMKTKKVKKKQQKKRTVMMKKEEGEEEKEEEEKGKGGRMMMTKKGGERKEKPVGTAAPGSRKRVKKEKEDVVMVEEEEREEAIVGGKGGGNGLEPGTPVAVLEGMVKKEVKERKVLVVKTEVVEATMAAPAEPSRRTAALRSRAKE